MTKKPIRFELSLLSSLYAADQLGFNEEDEIRDRLKRKSDEYTRKLCVKRKGYPTVEVSEEGTA